jgi:hypothetical protein
MTETPAYPGYATPTFRLWGSGDWVQWIVTASPQGDVVGYIERYPQGWTAQTRGQLYVGLFPDKQAAGEALVKHAGYGVL